MSTSPTVMVNHLDVARMTPYVSRCGGSDHETWALYSWNTQLAAAFHEVLAFVEVSLRNAVDRQLRILNKARNGKETWLRNPAAPLDQLVTFKTREELKKQAEQARKSRNPSHPRKHSPISHDDWLANTSFGFWRGMFPSKTQPSSIHAATSALWNDAIGSAFRNLKQDPHGYATADRVRRLHSLRNRVAHLENLLDIDIDERMRDAVQLVNAIDPGLRDWLEEANRVRHVASMRPHP